MTNKHRSARTEAMMFYHCFMEIDSEHKAAFSSLSACEEHLITALPDNVRLENTGAPVFPFFTVTQCEAREYVLNCLPYFKDEVWTEEDVKYNGLPHIGWVIRKDRIKLELIEQEIENMDALDIDLFLPVLCKQIYQCIVRNEVPDRLISYDPEENV